MTTTTETQAAIEASAESVGMSSSRLGQVSEVMERYIAARRYAGAITMVARRGKVVHAETYGSMDDEAGKPMAFDAIFRAASMTKPIASVALMQLYERALFQLDAPVHEFVPEFRDLRVFAGGTADSYTTRPPARAMTVRDVLTHTSGLISAGDGSAVAQLYKRAGAETFRTEGTLGDLVRSLRDLPLHCDPGSQWNYGLSTDIVAYLVEVISGQPFDRYLREHVFEPLGMPDTGFDVRPEAASRLAAMYRKGGGGAAGERQYVLGDAPGSSRLLRPATYFSGAAGLVTTAPDYMRFCKMLAQRGVLDGERLLGDRTVRFMAANHLPEGRDIAGMGQPTFGGETSMDGIGFGLGFAVLLDPARVQLLGTPGEFYWGGAYSTMFFVSPAEDLVVIMMTQLGPSSSYPVRRELRIAAYQAITD